MKKIILTLFIFTLTKYAVAQWASLTPQYYPAGVFDIDNFRVEAAYHIGNDFIKAGVFMRTDTDVDEISGGLGLNTAVLKLGESAEISINTALGFNFEQNEATKFNTDFHDNFVEVGLQISYEITEVLSIKQVYTKQYYTQQPVTYLSAGLIWKFE